MKHLKLITTISLVFTAISIAVATFNLIKLYSNEKENTMKTVLTCAENAVLLEMIGRMESSERASESYMRVNAFLEIAQQKEGHVAKADSIRTSLASLLRVGIDFKGDKSHVDFKAMDSIFRMELDRRNISSEKAYIIPVDESISADPKLWSIQYSFSPASGPDYNVYVSPIPGKVLSRMWGIIIPFIAIILLLTSLSFYLIKTINQMRTIEQMKEDFAHNMTHELKTPVAVAYSAADSMLRYYDQSDEARNRQFLRIIIQRLNFLSGMIENILSMSMERFKTMKLDIERIVLRPIVEEIAGMIELKTDKPIEINIDIPGNITVMADSLHLGNLLSNIIDNAVKYSGESVVVNIMADDCSITIADNGIGIEKGELPYIFDKFCRVSSGDRYEVGGYGLGLFYVRQIVELHGWNINVTSRVGHGTTFNIRFKSNEKR